MITRMAKSLQTAVSLHKAEIQANHGTWFVPLVSELLEISGSGRGAVSDISVTRDGYGIIIILGRVW